MTTDRLRLWCGGSFIYRAPYLRASCRKTYRPDDKGSTVGFRSRHGIGFASILTWTASTSLRQCERWHQVICARLGIRTFDCSVVTVDPQF